MSPLITTDAVGGVWNYSLALARGLAEQGESSTLAVLGPAPDCTQRAEAAAIAGCRLLVTGLPLEWTLADGDALAEMIAALIGVARASRATTVHLHAPALASRSWPIPTVAVAHSCMATWWDTVRGGARPADIAWHAQATACGLDNADMSVAPSRAFASQLAQTYRPKAPIEVIHNGLPPAVPVVHGRADHVLCAGRLWDESKNVALLDRVATRVRFPIYAAGPAAAPASTAALFASLHLLGTLSAADLANAMSQAAIFASPALYEPFGLAVLEAASLATPLVLADIPTFRELWTGAAIFVPANDEILWATALMTLMQDTAARHTLGRQAAARARTYSQQTMVTATRALHRRLRPHSRCAA